MNNEPEACISIANDNPKLCTSGTDNITNFETQESLNK